GDRRRQGKARGGQARFDRRAGSKARDGPRPSSLKSARLDRGQRRCGRDSSRRLDVSRPHREERLYEAGLLRHESVLGELVAEARNREDGFLAVDDPKVDRHQAWVLPALGEAELRVDRAILAGAHFGDKLLADFGDLAVLQLFVEAAVL